MSYIIRFCAALVVLSICQLSQAEGRPNVLFIAVDDLNHWVHYLNRNSQTITPHIDRLARRGVRFTHSYCAAPVCNPSRAALLSGLRPWTTGVYENNDDWRTVIEPRLTLPMTFRAAGYYVAGSGKIYHGSFDRQSDWDEYQPTKRTDPKPAGDKGVGGIRFAPVDCEDADMNDWHVVEYGIEALQKKHEKPFLLTIGIRKPHMPWYVPRKYYDLHPLDEIQLPPVIENDLADIPPAGKKMAKPQGDHRAILEAHRWKDAIQGYLAAVSFADAMVGRLIAALDASPYRDNTIIVFWGDHGWHLGEKEHWRKFTLWEEATRAPLIWVAPGVTQADSVCERTVDFMTIYPTLTDLAGIPTPGHVEGRSIRRLLADPNASWDEPAITTYEFNNHAVRTEKWRYIRYANGDTELYDETKDPYEWQNLSGESTVAGPQQQLDQLLPRTNAPDLSGRRG